MSTRIDNVLDTWKWDGNKQSFASFLAIAVRWFIELVKPQILQKTPPRRYVSRTAYLDGLRGFAAFLVYWQHHQLWPLRQVPSNRIFENGYGFEGRYYFAALPIVRTFFTGGHFAVALFFVISGYVLSAKPLALLYAGEYSELGSNIGSALFRRWIRLHLPIIVVTFLYMTSWHAFGVWTISPEHKPTYREELWNWYAEFKKFSFVFRTGGEAWFTYNFPTWSIPVEFRGSIVVYTSLMAFARATRNARLLCQIGLMYYFFYIVDGWFCAMFVAGMFLAELDVLARRDELPDIITRFKPWKTQIVYGFFCIAMVLSGVPSHTGNLDTLTDAPGWRHMAIFKPDAAWDQKWIFLFWSAILFITAVPHIWWLKAFFETTFNQYLGRISFALYLVHGPVIWTLGDRLYVATGWYKEAHETNIPGWIDCFPLSKAGPLGLEPSFLLPHIILLPFSLWLAEMVTKLVDEPTVKFSKWLYEKTLGPPKEPLVLRRSEDVV